MSAAKSGLSEVPVWAWVLLSCSVVGVSCAGSMFQQVDEIPPLLRASWRLQATSVVLLPLAYHQWCSTPPDVQARCFQPRVMATLAVSGVAIGVHFGAWVASVDMTTLTHSLLFVSSHPVVLALGMLVYNHLPAPITALLRGCGAGSVRSPNAYEGVGVVLGLLGASLAMMDLGKVQDSHTVTAIGDAVAFLGALAFILYQVCGRVLRVWMPIFLYALPVTLFGGVWLLVAALLWEPGASAFGALGWVSRRYAGWFMLMSLIAGLMGHTGLNTCLLYISPLLVCSALTLEPAIGSLVAYWVFDTELPGTMTWVGGSVLLFALMLVGYGGHISESCDGGSTGTGTGTGIGNGEKEVRGVEMGSHIGAGAGAWDTSAPHPGNASSSINVNPMYTAVSLGEGGGGGGAAAAAV